MKTAPRVWIYKSREREKERDGHTLLAAVKVIHSEQGARERARERARA